MPQNDDKAELIDAGTISAKPPEKPAVKSAETKPEEKKSSAADIVKGIAHIPKEGPGVTENKSEPHTHLLVLLIIVIVLGVIISFINI